MAAVTYDRPTKGVPAGRFFQNRATLVLNYAGIDEKDPRYESADRRIRRYISTLVEAKAIRVVRQGYRGQHAEYELLVDILRDRQDELPFDPEAWSRSLATSPDSADLDPVLDPERGAESVPPRSTEEYFKKRNNAEEPDTDSAEGDHARVPEAADRDVSTRSRA